jgi:hypothetical protein
LTTFLEPAGRRIHGALRGRGHPQGRRPAPRGGCLGAPLRAPDG